MNAVFDTNIVIDALNGLALASDTRPESDSTIGMLVFQLSPDDPIQLLAYGQDPVTISQGTLNVIANSAGLQIPIGTSNIHR